MRREREPPAARWFHHPGPPRQLLVAFLAIQPLDGGFPWANGLVKIG